MRVFFLTFLLVLFFQNSGTTEAPAADLRVPLPPKGSPATNKPNVVCTQDGTGIASCSIMSPEKFVRGQQTIGGPLK